MTATTAATAAGVSAGRTVVRRAPGKLFVAGEYAVVEPGNPAILVAVDRYITVTVTGTAGESGSTGTPDGPGNLDGPGASNEPCGPGGPGSPAGPGSPGGPGSARAPHVSNRPRGSGASSAPGNPSGSGTPDNLDGPGTPNEPATPTTLTAPDVVISSDLISRPVAWRWREGRLVAHGYDGGPGDSGSGSEGDGDGSRARDALAYVVSAVETVAALVAERGLGVPALRVSVRSALHEGGRKYGLGSSGAVTVAAVDAVAGFCGVELSAGERYRLAMLAGARIDPKGSGGDLAASAWGGWILYRAPDRDFVLDLARRVGIGRALAAPWPGHTVRRLPAPAGLRLEVGWTGEPVSTASLVAGLHRRGRPDGAARGRYTTASNHLVEAAAAALERGDGAGLLEQIRAARRELARLDEAVGLGIFTDRLTRLCEAAEAAGGAAKPSGAGGGDCGIALLDAAADRHICQVRRQWSAAGVQPLPVRPAAREPGRNRHT